MEISKHYNTYLSGTVGDVVRCTKIVLFNKKDTTSVTINGEIVQLPYLSLTNLKELWNDLRNSDEKYYIESNIDPTSRSFHIDSAELRRIGGFYDIIYINSLDYFPVGYTDFFSAQGENNIDGLTISLSFISDIKGDLEIKIDNTISRYSYSPSDFIGDESWNYTAPSNLKSWLGSVKKRDLYSTHLHSGRPVYLDNGTVYKDACYPVKLLNNIEIDPYSIGFNHYQVGYYSGDLVLYAWVDRKYRIVSLRIPNNFGKPYEYTLSGLGYLEVPGESEISYFSGRYVFLIDGHIYDMVQSKMLDGLDRGGYYYLMDRAGIRNDLIKIPYASDASNIINYLPEANYKSIYHPVYLNHLTKIIGGWFVYEESSYTIVTGMTLALKIPNNYAKRLMFINSRTLWLVSQVNTEYTIDVYSGTGLFTPEESLVDNEFAWKASPDNIITFSTESDPFTWSKAGLINYRRGPIPDTLNNFKFIDSVSGIIFYSLDDKILRYL